MKILLNTFEKVSDFVNQIAKVEDEVDLISGRYVVDAKSIMGIFSLNLSKPIEVHLQGELRNQKTMEILNQFAVDKVSAA